MTTEPKIEQVDRPNCVNCGHPSWAHHGYGGIPGLCPVVATAYQSSPTPTYSEGVRDGRQELLAEVLAWLREQDASTHNYPLFYANQLEAKFRGE